MTLSSHFLPHVLIADDNGDTLSMTQMAFKLFEVATFEVAWDGDEAIRKYDTGKFDALLLDVSMPVFDGWQVAEHVRVICNDQIMPIYLISAYPKCLEASIKEHRDFTINECLEKPLDFNHLKELLAGVLRHRTSGQGA